MAEWHILPCISNPFNDNDTYDLLYQVIEPWAIWMKLKLSNYQANFREWCLRYLLWDCPKWMSLDLTCEKATLIHVTSHYISQCSLISRHIATALVNNELKRLRQFGMGTRRNWVLNYVIIILTTMEMYELTKSENNIHIVTFRFFYIKPPIDRANGAKYIGILVVVIIFGCCSWFVRFNTSLSTI